MGLLVGLGLLAGLGLLSLVYPISSAEILHFLPQGMIRIATARTREPSLMLTATSKAPQS